MFVLNQKVILPKSHGEKEGVIVLVPKPIRAQSGLVQNKDRVKVSYLTVGGGATEAWFNTNLLQAWRKPADITAELEAKHQKEMEAVHATNEKEKLDWIQAKVEDEDKKDNDGQDFPENGNDMNVIEVNKDTDIQAEMKKIEAQPNIKKNDDNSDSYGG